VTLVVVTGTGTDVGKTWVTAGVAAILRARRIPTRAWKPAQSFAPDDRVTDAESLAVGTGQDAYDICPSHRWLPTPMAPPMAAAALGLPRFTIADLVAECPADDADGVLFVEGAGGVRSPLADDGDTRALADALRPDVVLLVADAGLGTINDVRLSCAALRGHTVVVHLNRFDAGNDVHIRNRDWLRTRDGLDVVTDIEAVAARLVSLSR
jgi:dethiobiotin synthetase